MTTIQTSLYCHVTSAPMLSAEILGFWIDTCKSLFCPAKHHLNRPEGVPLSSDALKWLFVHEQVSYLQMWIKTWKQSKVLDLNSDCSSEKANLNVVIWAYINSGTSDKLITLLLTKADWERQKSSDMMLYYMSRIGEKGESFKQNHQSATANNSFSSQKWGTVENLRY